MILLSSRDGDEGSKEMGRAVKTLESVARAV